MDHSAFQRPIFSGNRKPPGLAEASLHFVIPGRSKERSDAAQTLGSMRYLAAVLLRTGTVAAGEAPA
ncbi:MAG: hypothetical protein E5V71_13570, partial [Mesorhizobium sp.]